MNRVIKRLLYIVALVFLVTRAVDFSSSDFDPLRAQWQSSFDHIAQHQYFTDYVQPVQDKVNPFVFNIQESYITPGYVKVNSIASSKYETYLSKYAELIKEKIAASPVHTVWEEHTPKLRHALDITTENFSKFKEATTKFTALGLAKLVLALKYAHAQTLLHGGALTTKAGDFYIWAKPRVIAFYKDTVIPSTASTIIKIREGSCFALETVKKYTLTAYNQAAKFYNTTVHPFLENKVFVHLRFYYILYAKTYVDSVVEVVQSYYHIFKLNQALDISKRYLTGSYDQALRYFQEQEAASETAETSVDATTAEGEDIPTPTETLYEEMETPDIPETPYDEELEAETVKVFETITQTIDVDEETAVPAEQVAQELEKRNENDELAISLAQEIDAWKTYILKSVDNILDNFETSAGDVERVMVEDFRPLLKAKFSNMTTLAHKGYNDINKAIYDINSTSALLENGQEVEIDQMGNIIDHKITRQEIRDLLKAAPQELGVLAEDINTSLKAFVSDVEVAIEDERKLLVDIYEEFAEVAINEFSKKMMYSTFSSSFDNFQNKKDDESFNDWKEYVKVKNELIAKREKLINKKAPLPILNTVIVEVRETLRALDHETGNYYSILRAQANLAFQAREKKEAEAEASLEALPEEERTVTSLIVKFQTIGSDGAVETFSQELEPVSEEDISDTESDGEDFETPDEPVVIVDKPASILVSLDNLPEETDPVEDIDPVEESTPEEPEDGVIETEEGPADPAPDYLLEHVLDHGDDGIDKEDEEEEEEEEKAEETEDDDEIETPSEDEVDAVTPLDDAADAEEQTTQIVDTPEMRFATLP